MITLPKLRIEQKHFLNGRILNFSVLIDETGSMCIGEDNLKEMIHRCESQPDLLASLESFVDDEICQLDHHGYCQTHSLTKPCRNQIAKDLITKAKMG